MTSLVEKLKSLGVNIGISDIMPGDIKPCYTLDNVFSFQKTETIFGSSLFTEKEYPLDYCHGICKLIPDIDFKYLLEWGKVKDLSQITIRDFLFIDTETTGLAGGTGTFAFLIGLGYWEGKNFIVKQFFLPEPDNETAMLTALDQVSRNFKIIISFNGKTFDIPLLKTRYALNSIKSPISKMPHIDILHLARRVWSNRLSSRSLADLEREILLYDRDEKDAPGWMVPKIYQDYLATGDARQLTSVFYHNAIDIVSLAAVFSYLCRVLIDPVKENIPGLDLIAIAKINDELGYITNAINIYESGLRSNLPHQHVCKTLMRYADIFRKQKNWAKAVNIWEKATDYGEISAYLELAKYHEHRSRNYSMSYMWSERAVQLLRQSGSNQVSIDMFEKRMERLRKKL